MLHYLFCYCWGETNSLRDTRTGNKRISINSKQRISYIVSSLLFTQLHAATYITKCLGWLSFSFHCSSLLGYCQLMGKTFLRNNELIRHSDIWQTPNYSARMQLEHKISVSLLHYINSLYTFMARYRSHPYLHNNNFDRVLNMLQ